MRIGLFLRHLDEEFQITVFAGVRARAQERGIDLLCLQSEPFQPGAGADDRPFALAAASHCDGFLVLTPVLTNLTEDFLTDLSPWAPVVSVGLRVPGYPSVVFQSRGSLRRIVVHLVLDHGYRRFLFIGGPENHRDTRARLRVVRQCLDELGQSRPGLSLEVVYAGFTEYSVQSVLGLYLDGPPFDAIITANDNMAIGALRILKLEAGEAWSRCAVTGFDDIPQAVFSDPALTSVHQPLERLGARSLDALVELLEGGKIVQVGKIDCWPVIRESCGCPPAHPTLVRQGVPVPWGPGQKQAVEADRWLRAANYLASDLGLAETRSEVWGRLDGYLATLGLTDLALLESDAPRSTAKSTLRIVFHRRNSRRVDLDEAGRECADLGELLDSLDHLGGRAWDFTVAPLRSGPRANGLAVYSAPLNVHPYVGAVLPHVSHSLRRLQEMEEQKLRNLVLEEMVQKRTKELVLANDQLRNQRRGLETILGTLPLPLVLHRLSDRRVLYANPAFERAVGSRPDHRPLDEFLTLPEVCDGLELGLSTAGGESLPVLTYSVPIEYEQQSAVLVAMVDLSRQRALESEVLQASEWERRRFGLELHDDICQRLAGIVMYLKGLQNRRADGSANQEVTAMVDEALHLTRQYAHASFPIELERRGLAPALATLCESVESRTGRKVHLVAPAGDPVVRDPQRSLNIYRIVQEALHNAIKHGQAHNIEVTLTWGGNGLTVSIADDGRGMTDSPQDSNGLGLRSMTYRAAQIGARLEMKNHPGQGVVVTLVVL